MMPVYIIGGILVFGSVALILFFVIKNLIKRRWEKWKRKIRAEIKIEDKRGKQESVFLEIKYREMRKTAENLKKELANFFKRNENQEKGGKKWNGYLN